MLSTDEVLVEDWQGLENELERLFMIYGYPVDDLQVARDREEADASAVPNTVVPGTDIEI